MRPLQGNLSELLLSNPAFMDSTFSRLFKEVIKEQPTPTNLSATARRVLQCTFRSQWPSCSFKENFYGYSHRTVPETPSQIGFISVKTRSRDTLLGTLTWLAFRTGVRSSNCLILYIYTNLQILF